MRRLVSGLDDVINVMLLASVVVVMAVQVFSRYVLNHSLGWTSEAATILFAWLIFLGAPSMLKRQSHMGVWFFNWATSGMQLLVRVLIELVCGFFYVALLIGGLDLVKIGWLSVTPAMEISRGLIFLVVPVAAGLLVVRTLLRIWMLVFGAGLPSENASENEMGR